MNRDIQGHRQQRLDGRSAQSNRRWLSRAAATLTVIALAAVVACTSALAANRSFKLTVEQKTVPIGSGLSYMAWTYDGTVPGPILRADQGDEVSIRLLNHTSDAHGIDILGAQTSPSHFTGDPMATVSYSFKALVPGVFDYHCSAIPVLDHTASGMYGMMIIQPHGGWPDGPAQEITLIQGEFYGSPNKKGVVIPEHAKMLAADPSFIVFNGSIGHYDASNPIPIKVGKLVRVFFLNAGPNLSSTFHVSGVIFSTVYVGGNPANALHNVPSIELAPTQGAVVEFTVHQPGDYRFSDSAGAHSYKGALGIFRATK